MSRFSLPKNEDKRVDPTDLREFAAGAKDHRTHQGPPPWEKHDPDAVPKHNVSVRLNDYHLEMLRHLAKGGGVSQQKLMKQILVPVIEEQADNYIG